MLFDWQNMTIISSLTGGILIGAAAVVLIIFNGKVAGVSGVLGGLITAPAKDRSWRIAFILGLVLAPALWQLVIALPNIQVSTNTPLIIIAGLIVGIGTRLGSGCTSGHGVCGISRFSKRSLVATVTFMALGFITTFVARQLLGLV